MAFAVLLMFGGQTTPVNIDGFIVLLSSLSLQYCYDTPYYTTPLRGYAIAAFWIRSALQVVLFALYQMFLLHQYAHFKGLRVINRLKRA